ncbi:MAG: metal-dependent hydrolase [Rhodocyclaceae bacterium]|nr:metal-dependent hydrolase [Rhodocyclaceae bacterium]
MDTITHTLSGALVGRLFGRREAAALPPDPWRPHLTPGQAVTAGALAAAFPDLDIIARLGGELFYLANHRGITHSLILAPLWALLIARLMQLFWATTRHEPGGWKRFFLPVLAAIVVHILGDLITQFGTMVLAPFSDRRFGWGTTFIIDLGLSGILVAGLVASGLWRRSRAPALLGTIAVVGWIGVSATGQQEALAVARDHAQRQGIATVFVDAIARPASPFNWTALVYDGTAYHVAQINTRRQQRLTTGADDNFLRRFSAPYLPIAEAEWRVVPRFGADARQQEVARRVFERPEFAFFRWFAQYPFLAAVNDEGGEQCAWFLDLRFETPGRETPFRYGLCQASGDEAWRLHRADGGGRRAL